jgi:hypothetical protein
VKECPLKWGYRVGARFSGLSILQPGALAPGAAAFHRARVGGPPPLTFAEDTLFLCVATRDLQNERCEEKWSLPLEKDPRIGWGEIQATLRWHDGKVQYWICPTAFADRGRSGPRCTQPGGLSGVLLSNWSDERWVPKTGDSPVAGWFVRVDHDPKYSSEPVDNHIIVEQRQPTPGTGFTQPDLRPWIGHYPHVQSHPNPPGLGNLFEVSEVRRQLEQVLGESLSPPRFPSQPPRARPDGGPHRSRAAVERLSVARTRSRTQPPRVRGAGG